MFRILIPISEWGYWDEELVAPPAVFDEEGCSVDFVTPKVQRPIALPASYGSENVDPPCWINPTLCHLSPTL